MKRLTGSEAVNAAARNVIRDGGGFGDNKAFIVVKVWERMRPENPGVTLAEFKAPLWEMQRSGRVSLSRADLVEAIDSQLVSRSEFRPRTFPWERDDDFGGESYHFVRVRPV